jgi:hypothetical protein
LGARRSRRSEPSIALIKAVSADPLMPLDGGLVGPPEQRGAEITRSAGLPASG